MGYCSDSIAISRDVLAAKKSAQTFSVQCSSGTLWVMDVCAENRGRLHQKVCFPAAPMMGRNFSTPRRPGVRVRNVNRNPDRKNYVYVVLSSLIFVYLTTSTS